MLSEKPLLMSEKMLAMVAGPMAVVLAIAASGNSHFLTGEVDGTVHQ